LILNASLAAAFPDGVTGFMMCGPWPEAAEPLHYEFSLLNDPNAGILEHSTFGLT
jgi:hypothetical protein